MKVIGLTAVFLLIGVLVFRGFAEERGSQNEKYWLESASANQSADAFPRILWVQTDHELQAKAMEEGIVA